jgi:hypothetical protein
MRRLLTGGLTLALILAAGSTSAQDEDGASMAGALEPVLPGPRLGHTATSLPDGRVLLVGGRDEASELLREAELWDPSSGELVTSGALADAREGHSATLLSDGRVLVIGGDGDRFDLLASAELWDPTSGQFAAAGSLDIARESHTATLLDDGNVLVIGGLDDDYEPIAAAERWDPTSGQFVAAGSLEIARESHTATLLDDGNVLVIGGWDSDDDTLYSVERWDSAAQAFEPANWLDLDRADHTATLLPDGRVIVISDADGEIWDPTEGVFEPTEGYMKEEWRDHHTATLLPDGRVLVIGGDDGDAVLASAELWDPTTGKFRKGGSLQHGRHRHTSTLLPGGRVLVVGGEDDGGDLMPSELFEIPQDALVEPTPGPTKREIEDELGALFAGASWRAYRRSPAGVDFDPFGSGARTGVLFDELAEELHPSIDYAALFRFADAEALEGYWVERAAAAADQTPPRDQACADGQPGRGTWEHGEVLCYVSDSGTALLRWIDERSDTYGVVNAKAGGEDLGTLYRQWQAALDGAVAERKAAAAKEEDAALKKAGFKAAERILLKGIPTDIRETCVPRRSQNPTGTVAAVRCRPDVDVVRDMAYYLMELEYADRVLGRRIAEYVPKARLELGCDEDKPGSIHDLPFGGEACYRGDDGRASLRIVIGATDCRQLTAGNTQLKKPAIYIAVRGTGPDIKQLVDWREERRLTRMIEQEEAPYSDMCPHW